MGVEGVGEPAVGETNALKLRRQAVLAQTHAREHADGAASVAAVGKAGGELRPRHPNHSLLQTTKIIEVRA